MLPQGSLLLGAVREVIHSLAWSMGPCRLASGKSPVESDPWTSTGRLADAGGHGPKPHADGSAELPSEVNSSTAPLIPARTASPAAQATSTQNICDVSFSQGNHACISVYISELSRVLFVLEASSGSVAECV